MGMVAVQHGLTYSNVAIVEADQLVYPEIFALTETEYIPALVRSFEAANVIASPDRVIKEGLGPVTGFEN